MYQFISFKQTSMHFSNIAQRFILVEQNCWKSDDTQGKWHWMAPACSVASIISHSESMTLLFLCAQVVRRPDFQACFWGTTAPEGMRSLLDTRKWKRTWRVLHVSQVGQPFGRLYSWYMWTIVILSLRYNSWQAPSLMHNKCIYAESCGHWLWLNDQKTVEYFTCHGLLTGCYRWIGFGLDQET